MKSNGIRLDSLKISMNNKKIIIILFNKIKFKINNISSKLIFIIINIIKIKININPIS